MKNRAALSTVFLTILIDLLGFGIVLPLLPFYASSFQATPIHIGLLYSIYSFAQLIFSPLWGGISDRLGRRPIMLLSTFGASLAYIIFGFASSLPILFFSRFLAGVMGGNISTAQAYIADITTEEDRARGMGLVGAAYGIGFVIGPAAGALLIHPLVTNFIGVSVEHKYMIPGLAASLLSAISFLMVLLKLPETVDKKKSEKKPLIRSSVFTKKFWINIAASDRYSMQHLFAMLLGSIFIFSFSQSSLYSSFPLFCTQQLMFIDRHVGYLFAFMGFIAIVIQGGSIRVLVKKFGEKNLFMTGSVIVILGYMIIPSVQGIGGLLATMGILGLGWSLTGPTAQSLISKEADSSSFGIVMGSAQGISALGRVIGPFWGGMLYAAYFWLPFVATALILILPAIVGVYLIRHKIPEGAPI